ncbi:hypothetical protein ACJIZ3_013973 [Penstemon smallii]|uniref:Uncharacterized protein n=1 Tax=Penstemon smallii TaxID=265156 RepID=A0ABD3RI87_9LAMI
MELDILIPVVLFCVVVTAFIILIICYNCYKKKRPHVGAKTATASGISPPGPVFRDLEKGKKSRGQKGGDMVVIGAGGVVACASCSGGGGDGGCGGGSGGCGGGCGGCGGGGGCGCGN